MRNTALVIVVCFTSILAAQLSKASSPKLRSRQLSPTTITRQAECGKVYYAPGQKTKCQNAGYNVANAIEATNVYMVNDFRCSKQVWTSISLCGVSFDGEGHVLQPNTNNVGIKCDGCTVKNVFLEGLGDAFTGIWVSGDRFGPTSVSFASVRGFNSGIFVNGDATISDASI